MSTKPNQSAGMAGEWNQRLALVAGLLAALCFLKFGVPVVLPQAHTTPDVLNEWVSDQWPLPIGYLVLGAVLVYGFLYSRVPRDIPRWLLWAPVAWLGWQVLSTLTSRSSGTATTVLLHFGGLVGCYYLGLLALSQIRDGRKFWIPVGIALLIVLGKGFGQQYGGMTSTAEFIESNEATGWTNLPPDELNDLIKNNVVVKTNDTYSVVPEVLKRVRGGRISGTLVYANALAGIILLSLPAILVTIWNISEKLPKIGRMVLFGTFFYMGAACLVWSGSKAGWLVAMAMGLAWVLAQPLPRQWKIGILALVLIGGAGGFWFKYSEKLKNPTSVAARFDYWSAALKLTAERPILGHGPGTFGSGYTRIKKPESEPTKLVHNDYLEQACDSGLPGFAFFLAWIGGCMCLVWKKAMNPGANALIQAMALGLIGWALQSFVEFGLYVPAIAWTAMLMLGWLTGLSPVQSASTGSKP
ncbi:MAG TPA: O-antigen ligase family protein [Verrucomicrobiae bacterium]